ncbi:MAG: ribonuclease PH [Candidatus Riflebacteria bacterium]|nr:ribonuclease PH [Candidatus Riflebacteria bacterium]
MNRRDGRLYNQMREITIQPGYVKHPHGSALISFGDTRVLCTVMVEEKVPPFVQDRKVQQGWMTAEYSLLPAAGTVRNPRAGYGNNQLKGRVYEIQRMIGRALRSAVNLKKIGQRTLLIDCDVIQADGGTRTAAITGTMVALELAVKRLMDEGKLTENPIETRVAAISVGINKGEILLDLDYPEDSTAETDLNLVMTRDMGIIEIQSTAEEGHFSKVQLDQMLKLGQEGIEKLFVLQDKALGIKK